MKMSLLIYTLLIFSGFHLKAETEDKCAEVLDYARHMDWGIWNRSPMIRVYSNNEVKTDPVWKFAIKKFESEKDSTLIETENMGEVISYNFTMNNKKINNLNISKMEDKKRIELVNISMTKDCDIDQFVKNKSDVIYDKKLCDKVNRSKLGSEELRKCENIFSKLKILVEERSKELKKENKFLSTSILKATKPTLIQTSELIMLCDGVERRFRSDEELEAERRRKRNLRKAN